MFNGKTHAALDLLANAGKGGALHLDQSADASDPIIPKQCEKFLKANSHLVNQQLPTPSCLGNHLKLIQYACLIRSTALA